MPSQMPLGDDSRDKPIIKKEKQDENKKERIKVYVVGFSEEHNYHLS